jgi:hypothetical protein
MKKEYKELEIWLRLFEADIVTLSDNQKDDVADDIFPD